MTMKAGLYWHVHHDVLLEWCYDYDDRAEYIRTQKPEGERELRLRLFQPVRGKLPNGLAKARAELAKADAELAKARAEWDKADADLPQLRGVVRAEPE